MASNILSSTTTLILILCASASVSIDALVDTDGDPIRNGGQYYIVPRNIGIGGGLSLTSKKGDNSPCPYHITRDKDETFPGIPVRISSPYRIAFITPSLPINIAFKDVPNDVCMQPLGWQVVPDSNGQAYVVTGGGGAPFNPAETFMIQEGDGENVYKLQLAADSSDVGFFSKDGLLGITTDVPLPVVFKKAYDDVLAMKV